jgi:antitoxin component YwqK of YwqJK toxin-antitoxin module
MSGTHIGYKKCRNDRIVVLEILGETNEGRSNVVDRNHAKMRCSKALVLRIYDMHDESIEYDEAFGIHQYHVAFRYGVGEIVEPDSFNENIESVCTNGIHYFLSESTAYFYQFNCPREFTGTHEKRHDNGAMNTRKEYVCGVLTLNEKFYANGNLSERIRHGTAKTGSETSSHEYRYMNGHMKVQFQTIGGRREGKYESWYENGQSMEDHYLLNDRKNGPCKSWYENGQPKERYHIVWAGRKTGKYESWYENGQPKERSTYDNIGARGRIGEYALWYENGVIRERRIRASVVLTIHRDRHNIECNFLREKWYKTGEPKERGEYLDGMLHGSLESWYPDGQVSGHCRYVNGEKHGVHEQWYSNAQMKKRSIYINGVQKGDTEYWNSDGEEMADPYLDYHMRCFMPYYCRHKTYGVGRIIRDADMDDDGIDVNDTNGPYTLHRFHEEEREKKRKEKKEKEIENHILQNRNQEKYKNLEKWVQKGKRVKNHTYMKKYR